MPVQVSVIVPVYNVAAYLDRCLESLCNQTLRDIEIIVVNDGSTDGSAKIARAFAARDERVNLIEQMNQGLGYARNTGLRAATGTFVSFIDSDDWVDPTMMEAFVLEAERTDADLVIGTFFEVSSNERIVKAVPLPPELRYKIPPFHWSECPEVFYTPTPVWDKFYRRDVIVDNDISFIKENCEDIDFRWRFFTAARRISTMPDALYYYRVRGSSLTGGKQLSVDAFRTHDKAREFLSESGLRERLYTEFEIRELIEVLYLYFKARPAMLADKAFFTACYNLTKKAFDQIDYDRINHKFYYLSFPYILLALLFKYHDNPDDYRSILVRWQAEFGQRVSRRVLGWVVETNGLSSGEDAAGRHIEHSVSFFGEVKARRSSLDAYPDEPTHPAIMFGDGTISLLPPVTAASGPPAIARLTLQARAQAKRLFAVIWSYQPERIRTLHVWAEVKQAGAMSRSITRMMPRHRWYDLIALDLSGFDPSSSIELSFWVEGGGPFPIHYSGIRLSHFQII